MISFHYENVLEEINLDVIPINEILLTSIIGFKKLRIVRLRNRLLRNIHWKRRSLLKRMEDTVNIGSESIIS